MQVEKTFETDSDYECDNHPENSLLRIVVQPAILAVVKETQSALKKSAPEKVNIGNYCQWFICTMHPKCGKTTSPNNYLYMKNEIGCFNLPSEDDDTYCSQCSKY